MSDINLYLTYPEKYNELQHLRPDYFEAINVSISMADRYTQGWSVILLDLCCGTGTNSLEFSRLHPLDKAVLVDINQHFLKIASNSGIDSKELEIINSDVRTLSGLQKEYNLAFSIFAYHHLPDRDKQNYADLIKQALVPGGILILTEIFFDSKEIEKGYYSDLYNSIPLEKRSDELRRFLDETANSVEAEFKVSKNFAQSQFKKAGFKLLEEYKVWPKINDTNGTFIQVYQL